MTTRPELAYSFHPKLIGGNTRTFVHAICSRCKNPQQVQWNRENNPRKIAARFQRLGWDFDAFKAGRNLCAECNPHHKEKTLNAQLELPTNFKTPGERVRWLRARLQLQRVEIAEAAHMSERHYKMLEDDHVTGFHELHTSVGKVVPVFRQHNLPVTLRWILGLPATGSCLALNFKAAMESKSLTPGFLASHSGISLQSIEGILDGSITSFYRLDDLARYLGTTSEVLRSDVALLPPREKRKPAVPAVIEPPPANPPALVAAKAEPPSAGTPQPLQPVTEITDDRLELVGHRLKLKRDGESFMSQAELADRIYDINGLGDTIAMSTLQNRISKIERAQRVPRMLDILRACAVVFHTNPEWQCGAGDEPCATAPAASISLPTFDIEVRDTDSALRLITALQADMQGIQTMIASTKADLQGQEELLAETCAKVGALEQAYRTIAPVEASAPPVPVPAEPPAILIAQPDAHEAALAGIMSGVHVSDEFPDAEAPEPYVPPEFSSWVSNAAIDREADNKQNTFAKFLTPHRFGDKTLTLDDMLGALKHTIENVILPGVRKPRESVRRMVLREALAPNGKLVQVADGSWQLRESVLVAA